MKQTESTCSLPASVESALQKWFNEFNPEIAKPLSSGYQGHVWLFKHPEMNLVIKAVPSHGFGRSLLRLTLRHEYRVYKKLYGIEGIPCCYGLFRNRFLVLEHIDGESMRQAELIDREYFYKRFFDLLQVLHNKSVAHVDLKRKDNILVVNGREPYLIDFGVAIFKFRKLGPLNNCLFNIGQRFDYNAWIKHKYNRSYDLVSKDDRVFLRITATEKIARFIKQTIRRVFPKTN